MAAHRDLHRTKILRRPRTPLFVAAGARTRRGLDRDIGRDHLTGLGDRAQCERDGHGGLAPVGVVCGDDGLHRRRVPEQFGCRPTARRNVERARLDYAASSGSSRERGRDPGGRLVSFGRPVHRRRRIVGDGRVERPARRDVEWGEVDDGARAGPGRVHEQRVGFGVVRGHRDRDTPSDRLCRGRLHRGRGRGLGTSRRVLQRHQMGTVARSKSIRRHL